MLYEPTTLASVARLIGETLEADYIVDPAPIFAEVGIDTGKFYQPGARVTFARMSRLWAAATQATADDFFGFKVGARARPGDFFVLGHVWLASATIAGALGRMRRHSKVVSTVHRKLGIERRDADYVLTESWPDSASLPPVAARDAGYVALIGLIDVIAGQPVRPVTMSLTVSPERRSHRYDELFRCPVGYGCDRDVWVFRAADLDRPLSGSVPDVLHASDRIADRYVESFDDSTVATSVRQLLVQLLPAGKADQDRIAGQLYRSTSTLQRQLQSEGTNYREVLDSTRRALAEQYLQDGQFSQAQIAFMVGFADQSNFARAFKRWTGMSPGEFQEAA